MNRLWKRMHIDMEKIFRIISAKVGFLKTLTKDRLSHCQSIKNDRTTNGHVGIKFDY
jgi:hypothetical protein